MKWFQLYVFGLSYAVKQQYILNLTNVWLYFEGRGNMATAAFFRDLKSLRLKFVFFVFFFHFPSSLLIPILFEPSVLVSGMMSSCSFFCEGTAHTSTENKHYSCFSFSFFSVMLHIIVFILECVWRWYESCFFLKGSVFLTLTLKKRWSHISKRPGIFIFHRHVRPLHFWLGSFWCFTVRLCFVSAQVWLFSVNNVKSHSAHVFLCCNIDF